VGEGEGEGEGERGTRHSGGYIILKF
jgi:hypothetical protein